MSKTTLPKHFTQAFKIKTKEADLDFFDCNLSFDTRLFLDPFLIKRSPIKEEQVLFKRFEIYFKKALELSLKVSAGRQNKHILYNFLLFPEPKEVYLGYTEGSSEGSGLGGKFARGMTSFFLKSTGEKIVGNIELYEDIELNPELFLLFTEGIGEDGISDLTVNLMMDYLIKFTQKQCEHFKIPLKSLPVEQSFDFNEMKWTNGIYANLPENPVRPGLPVVLVPKRLLRSSSNLLANLKSKAVGLLRSDKGIKYRFASLVQKPISEINLDDIRSHLLGDEYLLKNLIKLIDLSEREKYDFVEDPLEFLSIKKFSDIFKKLKLPKEPNNCEDFFKIVNEYIRTFKEDFEIRDTWKDCWVVDKNGKSKEILEKAWGRRFRGMGYAYFKHFPTITFIPEAESGAGPVDFLIVFLSCKVAIEIKKLSNSSPKGKPPIPSYIHGIKRQLPGYAIRFEANYAVYLTGQHRFRFRGVGKTDHSIRRKEIEKELPKIESELKKKIKDFKKLKYINVDLAPKPSMSKI